ncbi:tc_p033c [Abalone herpesvirus Taiwan/2004]|uniref:Uncharacterized protein n=1 Tax=Abalone herpesvirus Taiwan/2005 TaxID=1821058 RepID=A0A145VV79_9VIRU|nr:tc_p033c [Abalone herpesvirus Taiwan/2004]AMW36229.1 hypothetical protein tc2005_p085c [Abalone herpesvirus Taiwan/2005]
MNFKKERAREHPSKNGVTYMSTGDQYKANTHPDYNQWVSANTLEAAYEMIQPRRNVLMFSTQEPASGMSSILVVMNSAIYLHKPNRPGVHGVSYAIIQEKEKNFRVGTNLNLLSEEAKVWLDGHLVFEEGVFRSPFELATPSSGMSEKESAAYNWWYELSSYEETSLEAQEFIQFVKENQGKIGTVNSPEFTLEVIYEFLLRREQKREEEIKKIKNEFHQRAITFINRNQLVDAANFLKMTRLAQTLSEVDELVKGWDPSKIKSGADYIEECTRLITEASSKMTDENETPPQLEEIDADTANLLAQEIKIKWLNELENKRLLKDFKRMKSIPMKPIVTLGELKGDSAGTIEEAKRKREGSNKKIQRAIAFSTLSIKNSLKKFKEHRSDYMEVFFFTKERNEKVLQNEGDDWLKIAVEEPYDDYYTDLPPAEKSEEKIRVCDDVIRVLETELEKPIVDVLKEKLKDNAPASFWDLTMDYVNNTNQLVKGIYQTFGKNVLIQNPFTVQFYKEGTEDELGYIASPFGAWYSESQIEDDIEAAKNYKKVIQYRKKFSVVPNSPSVQPSDEKEVNASTIYIYTLFAKFYEEYNAKNKKIISVQEAQKELITEYNALFATDSISAPVTKLVKNIKEKSFDFLTYFVQLDPSNPYVPTIESKTMRNIVLILKFGNYKNLIEFEAFCKSWDVIVDDNDGYMGSTQHLLDQLKPTAEKKIAQVLGNNVNKVINEMNSKYMKEFKINSAYSGDKKWNLIRFLGTQLELEARVIQSNDPDAKEVIDKLYRAYGVIFIEMFICIFLQGISPRFVMNRTLITEEEEKILKDIPDLTTSFAKEVIANLGIFPPLLFAKDITSIEEQKNEFFNYILSSVIHKRFPVMFLPLDLDGTAKLFVAANMLVPEPKMPKEFLSLDKSSDVYSFMSDFESPKMIYSILSPEKKVVQFDIALKMILTKDFYREVNDVSKTVVLPAIDTPSLYDDRFHREMRSDPFPTLLGMSIGGGIDFESFLRNFSGAIEISNAKLTELDEGEDEDDYIEVDDDFLSNTPLFDDLSTDVTKNIVPRPAPVPPTNTIPPQIYPEKYTPSQIITPPPAALPIEYEEAPQEFEYDEELTAPHFHVQTLDSQEEFKKKFDELVVWLSTKRLDQTSLDQLILGWFGIPNPKMIDLLLLKDNMNLIEREDSISSNIKSRVFHFYSQALKTFTIDIETPKLATPERKKPEEVTNLISLLEEIQNAGQKPLVNFPVPPVPLKTAHFRIEVEDIGAHLMLTKRFEEVTRSVRASIAQPV